MPARKPRVRSEKRWFLWDRKMDGFVRTDADLPGWVRGFESEVAAWDYCIAMFGIPSSEFNVRFLTTSVNVPLPRGD